MKTNPFVRFGIGVCAALVIWSSALAYNSLVLSFFGPTRVSGSSATVASGDTVAAAGTGISNCLTDFDVISASTYTFIVLDGATTIYYLRLAAGQGLIRSWDVDTALCGSANTILRINVLQTSADNYDINYRGFTK